ncbi:hypothetical protein Q4517_01395 [Tenacibaculum sp. 1_MG-2023]|uniref:hypothetical protein n=1 Tax=Tenacibaculum sp. 1_MG-2023 TaxID=3062653 RepID=UPI0026E16FE4|nr:hypothetical protein [Tenacibaculum sp. 1_MG-2023]MDO6674202.1 hypothetical protein [Tenacibaculum sp. 1_MG-2023]
MNKLILYILVFFLYNCSVQKEQMKNAEIKQIQLDTLVEKDILLMPLYVDDYSLEDKITKLKIIINEYGLYQFKDSVLVDGEMEITLHEFSKIDKDKITDCEEPPIPYGYLEGDIINGKKEGKWLKKIQVPKPPYNIIVKILHYKNGVLDGKYQVYNTKGRALYPMDPHPLYPDEYKDYQIFKKGTGWYYDYYYEKEILKVKGYYINSIKEGAWVYYDKNGNETHREYYKKGVLINE